MATGLLSFIVGISHLKFVVMDRKQAIDIIDTGVICSIELVKCDRHRKKGGQLVYYPAVQKLISMENKTPSETPGQNLLAQGKNKNPRHSENATRNLRNVQTGTTMKIHLHLLTMLNNKEVIW